MTNPAETTPAWRRVYLVVERLDGLEVVQREGRPLRDTAESDWLINTRSPGCSTKQIEVVDRRHVHLAHHDAEEHLRNLLARRP